MIMLSGINKYILNIKMCIGTRVYMAIFDSHQIMMSCLNLIVIKEMHSSASQLQIHYVYCVTQCSAPKVEK